MFTSKVRKKKYLHFSTSINCWDIILTLTPIACNNLWVVCFHNLLHWKVVSRSWGSPSTSMQRIVVWWKQTACNTQWKIAFWKKELRPYPEKILRLANLYLELCFANFHNLLYWKLVSRSWGSPSTWMQLIVVLWKQKACNTQWTRLNTRYSVHRCLEP